MVKSTFESRLRAVILYGERVKSAKEICQTVGISERTLRRWISAYRNGGAEHLNPKKMGPKGRMPNGISKTLEDRILGLKQEHPSWGARRIKYQYDLPCEWRTVHNLIKHHNLLIRIKKKPQPKPKRFRRKHVDSIWVVCATVVVNAVVIDDDVGVEVEAGRFEDVTDIFGAVNWPLMNVTPKVTDPIMTASAA